ncbi:MAG: hypothetical protein R3E10_08170 [Gemmatimonadota bacterium]
MPAGPALAGSRSPSTFARMKRKTWISWHRWLAGIGGALLIALSITGLWYPLQVYFPALRGRVPEVGGEASLDLSQVTVSAAEAAQRALDELAGDAEVRTVQLTMMGPHAVYDIRTSAGRKIVRALDGESFRLTQQEAEALVRQRYGLGEQTLEGAVQEGRSLAYWGDVGLPAYVFTVAGSSSPVWAVNPIDARVHAGTLMQRISEGLMRAHQFWPIEEFAGRTLQRAVLVFSGVLSLLLGVTGYFLLFPLRWRLQRGRSGG